MESGSLLSNAACHASTFIFSLMGLKLFLSEFENAETLLMSEVYMLLDHRKKTNESAEDEQELNEVIYNLDYLVL